VLTALRVFIKMETKSLSTYLHDLIFNFCQNQKEKIIKFNKLQNGLLLVYQDILQCVHKSREGGLVLPIARLFNCIKKKKT